MSKKIYNIIYNSFVGDSDLIMYCDQSIHATSVKEIVDETYKRIIDFKKLYKNKLVHVKTKKNTTIGYYFYIINNNKYILVSFGLNKQYRNELSFDFFSIIKQDLKNFNSILFSNNTRAINWLLKNGCVLESIKNELTYIKY